MLRRRPWLLLAAASLVLAGPEAEAKKDKKLAAVEAEVQARAEAWFQARQGFEPKDYPRDKVAAATYPFLPPTFQAELSEEEWLNRIFSHATTGNERKEPILEGEGGFPLPLVSATIDAVHVHRDAATVDATLVFLADPEQLPTKHRTVWVKQDKEWYLSYRMAEHWVIAASSWHDRDATNQKKGVQSVLGATLSEPVLAKGFNKRAFSAMGLAAKLDQLAHAAYALEGKDKRETQAKREALGQEVSGKAQVSDVGMVLSVNESKEGGAFVVEVLCGRLIALIPVADQGDQRMLGMRVTFNGTYTTLEPRLGTVIEQPWVLEQPRGKGKSSMGFIDRYPSACVRVILALGTKIKLEK